MNTTGICEMESISLKALVEKEDRPQYRIVAEGNHLTQCYEIFATRPITSHAASTLPIHSRLDAVEILMQAVEVFEEDRAIVSVAMNFLDRFISLESLPYMRNGFDHESKNSYEHVDTNLCKNDETQYCLGMFVLISLDLAIRLYSPTSGDAFRNAVQRVSDSTSTDPTATATTLSNDMEIMGSDSKNEDASGTNRRDLFFQEVKKLFYSEKIYHATKFNSLRRLSNHEHTQDFANAQSIFMKKLDFYLCPVLPSTLVQYMLQSIDKELSSIALKYDFQIATIIRDYAIYLVELSSYCSSLVNIRPSIIAFSAITNAMKIFLPDETRGLRKKLSFICIDTLQLPIQSKETKCVGRLLFHMWKDNYPASIHSLQNDDIGEKKKNKKKEDMRVYEVSSSSDAARVSPDTVTAMVMSNQDIDLADPMIVLPSSSFSIDESSDCCTNAKKGNVSATGTRKRAKVFSSDGIGESVDVLKNSEYSGFVPISD